VANLRAMNKAALWVLRDELMAGLPVSRIDDELQRRQGGLSSRLRSWFGGGTDPVVRTGPAVPKLAPRPGEHP